MVHKLHCNNKLCQDRSNCELGNRYKYGDHVIYGLGKNSSECPDFKQKGITVEEVDNFLIDSDGIGAP